MNANGKHRVRKTSELAHLRGRICFHILNMAKNDKWMWINVWKIFCDLSASGRTMQKFWRKIWKKNDFENFLAAAGKQLRVLRKTSSERKLRVLTSLRGTWQAKFISILYSSISPCQRKTPWVWGFFWVSSEQLTRTFTHLNLSFALRSRCKRVSIS